MAVWVITGMAAVLDAYPQEQAILPKIVKR
jgi:hypothetical protein